MGGLGGQATPFVVVRVLRVVHNHQTCFLHFYAERARSDSTLTTSPINIYVCVCIHTGHVDVILLLIQLGAKSNPYLFDVRTPLLCAQHLASNTWFFLKVSFFYASTVRVLNTYVHCRRIQLVYSMMKSVPHEFRVPRELRIEEGIWLPYFCLLADPLKIVEVIDSQCIHQRNRIFCECL